MVGEKEKNCDSFFSFIYKNWFGNYDVFMKRKKERTVSSIEKWKKIPFKFHVINTELIMNKQLFV